MTINNRYVNHSSVWHHNKLELIDTIVDQLDKKLLLKTWEEKRDIRNAIEEELEEYTLYRCHTHSKGGAVGWRVLYALFVLFQWLLWPYCFFNWLKTGNFRLNSKSRIGMFIDRIVEQATN
ncbi:hypothetical protein [Vibrio scophthalmi]|uniref:Uncharacterized protein n=1 Tax=Vibrio scophthalmi LMG 19158 TaxID=870967 RepID=F9RI89_9VIBR|nr:hypothetical protein [Vibrio scophthalmi]EGU42421.1 hypothetical protein VIS19158_11508 [Vibrio scophthalmi LMG 19158]